MTRLQNRIAIVTGAARGIGLACAQRFATEARPSCSPISTRPRTGRRACSTRELSCAPTSRARRTSTRSSSRRSRRHGRIDILVNNAGITHACDFLDLAEEDFDRVLA